MINISKEIVKKDSLEFSIDFKIDKSQSKLINPEFSIVDVLVCHSNENPNGSSISKESIERNLSTIYGIPLTCRYHEPINENDDGDFGGHDTQIVIDNSANATDPIKFIDLTKPVGFVTKEALSNSSWVWIEDAPGLRRQYLKLPDCVLWETRYKECKLIAEKNYPVSMEISDVEGHYRDEDNIFEIENFIFSAICILGSTVCPAMQSAQIGRNFSLDIFKADMQLMMEQYKTFSLESQSLNGESDSDLNINSIPKIEQNQNNPKKEEDVTMELNPIVVEKVKASLKEYTYKSNADKTYEKYALISMTDKDVTFYDREDTYKSYTTPYIVTEPKENEFVITIDFDAKTENEIKSEFSIQKEVDTMSTDRVSFALSEQESAMVKDWADKFDKKEAELQSVISENKIQKDQIEVFVREKEEAKKKVHKDTTDTIISSFARFLKDNADFNEYRARLDYSKSTEDVEHDCALILSNQTLTSDKARFSKFGYNGVEAGIVTNKNLAEDPMRARYGDAFDKF